MPSSPFASFAPAYDSANANISFTESIRRARTIEIGQASSSSAALPPLPSRREGGLDVGEELAENWKAMRRLQEMQSVRVREGCSVASEEESLLGPYQPRLCSLSRS